jgi:hypothetical protein
MSVKREPETPTSNPLLGGYYFSVLPPYQQRVSMTFKKQGLYYLQVYGWPGTLRLNKDFGAYLYVDFDTPETNIKFLKPYFSVERTNEILESKKNGFGFYAFWVK